MRLSPESQKSGVHFQYLNGKARLMLFDLPTPSFFSWTLAVPPSPLGAPGFRPGSQGDSRRQHRPGYGWPGKYLFHPPEGAGCFFPPHPRRNHRLRMPSKLSWLPGLRKPLKLGVGKSYSIVDKKKLFIIKSLKLFMKESNVECKKGGERNKKLLKSPSSTKVKLFLISTIFPITKERQNENA